jgi:uroporphyrinogen-III synthase
MRANNGALMKPTLIVTRPIAQSEYFAASVASAWDGPLDLIVSQLIKIVPIKVTAPDVDAVIFTSANGVDAAATMGLPAELAAWCVGGRTAQAAQQAGFAPITGPGDADGLVAHLISAHPAGTFAHIRGKHTRGDVCARMNAAGLHCQDVVAYDQQSCALSAQAHAALNADNPVVVPLFSPRTSAILSEQGPYEAAMHVIALSNAVKKAIDPALNWDITVVSSPDGEAMKRATLAALRRINVPD